MICLLSVSFPISENVHSTRADIFLSFVCCHIPELRIVPGMEKMLQFSMIQSLGHIRLFVTPWTAGSMPGFPVYHQLLELAQTRVHQVSDAIQPSHPLLSLLLLPSIFPSIRLFSNESVLHIRWPKYWSFSFSISPSNEYSGLISFRKVWLGLLADQGTLKSLLQHHSSKASILWYSAFFIVQLSHPYMTARKTIVVVAQFLSCV